MIRRWLVKSNGVTFSRYSPDDDDDNHEDHKRQQRNSNTSEISDFWYNHKKKVHFLWCISKYHKKNKFICHQKKSLIFKWVNANNIKNNLLFTFHWLVSFHDNHEDFYSFSFQTMMLPFGWLFNCANIFLK